MKHILYLTFYFEPDLSAGSFRNTTLVKELSKQSLDFAEIDVFTSMPNRYNSFKIESSSFEEIDNLHICRISLPKHKNGMKGQIFSFRKYFKEVRKRTALKKYDIVFASSSRLFTAYLGFLIAKEQKIPLYLDIRDIFLDTMEDVLKSFILKKTLLPIFKIIERKVFNYATHINLISAGFKSYFDRYTVASYSYFSNGIDEVFLNLPLLASENKSDVKTIVYAGNIGEGQGLHKIIPDAARYLGPMYQFVVIGDGGMKQKLLDKIEELSLKNVKVLDPVKREKLISIYCKSDFLFMHLNDYDAFKKVLPSKVFELGAFDKPIIAGVAGYAKLFVSENLDNCILFEPCNVNDFVSKVVEFKYYTKRRIKFIDRFSRSKINYDLAKSILNYL